MNILIQASLVTLTACLNYGGNPYVTQSKQYVGCYVNRPLYSLVMADLRDNKRIVFTTLKP